MWSNHKTREPLLLCFLQSRGQTLPGIWEEGCRDEVVPHTCSTCRIAPWSPPSSRSRAGVGGEQDRPTVWPSPVQNKSAMFFVQQILGISRHWQQSFRPVLELGTLVSRFWRQFLGAVSLRSGWERSRGECWVFPACGGVRLAVQPHRRLYSLLQTSCSSSSALGRAWEYEQACRCVSRKEPDAPGGFSPNLPGRKKEPAWGCVIKSQLREFPGGSVVRTPCSHCQGPGSIPGRGTKILQAAWCKLNKSIKSQWSQKEEDTRHMIYLDNITQMNLPLKQKQTHRHRE